MSDVGRLLLWFCGIRILDGLCPEKKEKPKPEAWRLDKKLNKELDK